MYHLNVISSFGTELLALTSCSFTVVSPCFTLIKIKITLMIANSGDQFYILFSLTSSFSIIIINLCITKYFAKHFQLCMHDQAIFTQKQEQRNFTKVSKNIFPLKSLLFKIDSVLSEKKSKMFRLNSKFTNDRQRIIYEHRNQQVISVTQAT